MLHAVFKDRDTLVEVMKALREADYGYSVVVSGLVDDVDCCAKKAGIQRHAVDLSLGIWGAVQKLPDEQVMEITTMCGHAMISANLVYKMIDDIKRARSRPNRRRRSWLSPAPAAYSILTRPKHFCTSWLKSSEYSQPVKRNLPAQQARAGFFSIWGGVRRFILCCPSLRWRRRAFPLRRPG